MFFRGGVAGGGDVGCRHIAKDSWHPHQHQCHSVQTPHCRSTHTIPRQPAPDPGWTPRHARSTGWRHEACKCIHVAIYNPQHSTGWQHAVRGSMQDAAINSCTPARATQEAPQAAGLATRSAAQRAGCVTITIAAGTGSDAGQGQPEVVLEALQDRVQV